ncbi:hypothetical protein ACFE04_013305 [Oxalis oulophora]
MKWWTGAAGVLVGTTPAKLKLNSTQLNFLYLQFILVNCMDMDNSTGQAQEMMNGQSMMLNICTKKPTRPQQAAEHSLKCPRCESTNTKFCYYNNYSLSQPRYFCKSCRRYWTKGGTLRNVPVGGGCRKNHKIIRSKRSSSSSSLSNQSELSDTITNSNSNSTTFNIPPLTYDHHDSNHDLTLAFARLQNNFGNPSVYADNFITNPNSTQGFLGFVDHHGTQNNFNQNVYLGAIDADNINNNNNNNIGGEIMQLQSNYGDNQEVNYMTNNVAMKQEIIISNGENYENGKVLWGFPWQNGEIINIDSGKDSTQSWINNTRGLNYWHGLINSPLM